MKKKIMAMCLVIAMAATAVIGGTLAYFTDTDEETNVFTMGGVKIDLIEQQFNEKDELVTFEDNKQLMPGKENSQDKIVTIKNEGESPAFVWYEWFIPSFLDTTDGKVGRDNILHVNSYGATWDNYYTDAKYKLPEIFGDKPTSEEGTWDHDPEKELKITPPVEGPEGFFDVVEIDGIEYNKYVVLHHGILESGKTTLPAMSGVYLDKRLDMNANGEYTFDGTVIDVPQGFSWDNMQIIVNAYGIQAELADMDNDGDVDVYDAYLAYQAN